MLSTLKEIRESGVMNIAGVSPTGSEFTRIVNEATEMLLIRGDWAGTVIPIQVCGSRGCATFPRYVGEVRKMNVCGTPIGQHNMYWDFLPKDTYNCSSGCAAPWLGSECSITSKRRAPTYFDVWGEGRYVRVYMTDIHDKNKTVTLIGWDNNGQPYQETLTMLDPTGYVQSSRYVRTIDRVLKDKTKGRVLLRGYNTADGSVEEISTIEPSETNPSLLRVFLNIPGCTTGTTCPTTKPLAALVKLQFVPVEVETDLVLIENKVALKKMIQSIRRGEQEDIDGAAKFEAAAIRELNLQLWNQGDDQIAVRSEPFNGVYVGQQCI